ncbi:methylenetetrahydrofolate--tRNA-(uracil(54)-C(5))-methyltransferase (FADH(2)-oxidizing) TrmFO [Lactobacillus iners]|jgi:methylenetetrahydrofolate--tRNA-(uracil-5-)-methyltransferase|uniref:methylenetetrahydrofolate--tRNA-(uracil(54)- C(5))-methyltransferase (FADH(2)-oxidizing) TrmFO n=1 Tax=Lactobacillus iners TaxID=147802 RepID=UPI0002072FC6|nr:methylenetetrahydrofolate--tRNA-(uracil(54)-C(5))-methyltransferase (FADH(2)-oxidizing) TrmFO [Lactobacillus iners]EGG31108.1 tRNA:m(5)U-54 methyltransferase [Lactobacillus iners SPIN 1401G]MCT7716198.1 methylenetetrahydrofolate--tRNA-(uracil(54)-C(5))-methyltransferase (FADH(2)-oxidizing) TrmFO [Lactobacillus iners]MCT7729160.1 methylenetetrahydrofolate--tRNA-(uracil(54)-C(5))-methyltransferase (FADH(2)-oxidizing) TrmFO [Lactobacillus iners]MCT7835853.1 methylenetetrahydrofolate--tRNA-(urac
MPEKVTVIGGGLAGSEATWQLAKRGIEVDLYEMRPVKMTPAHETGNLSELVCTNSMRSNQLSNAVGLLKEEMRQLDSLIMRVADETAVPAGGALAVDRDSFSKKITQIINELPNVHVHNEEIKDIPKEGINIIATGPLTSDSLATKIKEFCGSESLHFFDAAAPIITAESIDYNIVYKKSRYDKGEAAYLNCPMDKEQFVNFYNNLITAETAELHEFEKNNVFEGCMPIEVMAKRGEKTMLFGPLKPVGLEDPKTGKLPYAVVQLRQDNASASMYNIVGFQTHLKFGEQKRVFSLIPGLANAVFVRYGKMHRNTYISSPEVLNSTYETKLCENLFFAGQMTGVEGYVESAGSGLVAGINASLRAIGESPIVFPKNTAIGSMANYITSTSAKNFQPMNASYSLMPQLEKKIRNKQERHLMQSKIALDELNEFKNKVGL